MSPPTDGKGEDLLVNLTRMAAYIPCHRETLRRWVGLKGCPVVKRTGKSHKDRWIFCVPDVVSWIREQERKDAAPDPATVTLIEAERRERAAKAELAEIALARERAEFVSVTDVGDVIGGEYQVVRRKIRALPSRLAILVRAAGSDEEGEDLLAEGIDECLAELAAAPDLDALESDLSPPPSPKSRSGSRKTPKRRARKKTKRAKPAAATHD